MAEVLTPGSGETPGRSIDPASMRWLHGPVSDLLLGCGLLYFVMFAALGIAGVGITSTLSLGTLAVIVIFTGAPHYGATLLRVYEHRQSRRRYAVFAVWISLLLVALFGVSLYQYPLGILLVSVYIVWNPWHYAGQNYGLAVMFLRRRGVEVTPAAKNLFYASFVLSALLAMVAMNATRPQSVYGPGAAPGGAKLIRPVYHFDPLGIPDAIVTILLVVGLLGYGVCLVVSVGMLLRRAKLGDLVPALLLVFTQSLWFVLPVATQHWGVLQGFLPFDARHSEYTFLFIGVGHAVQYLWVTSYFAKKTESYPGNTRYWLRCVLAGTAVWNVPPLLLGMAAIGTVAYNDGLALLVAAVVNLHHFILDGAIWKLRDTGIGRVLLREPDVSSDGSLPPPISDGGRPWGRLIVMLIGACGASVALASWYENEFGFVRPSQRGDEERMQLAVDRLELIGRPRDEYYRHLATIARSKGDDDRALLELDKSLAVREHPKSHFVMGHIHRERGDWAAAADAYERAYAIDPNPVKLIALLSQALRRAGRLDRADEVLREGLRVHPGNDTLLQLLREVDRARADAA